MNESILYALLLSFLAGAATSVGGLLSFVVKKNNFLLIFFGCKCTLKTYNTTYIKIPLEIPFTSYKMQKLRILYVLNLRNVFNRKSMFFTKPQSFPNFDFPNKTDI